MLMTLIRSCLQGRELKPFICVEVQDHLRFIDFTSERAEVGMCVFTLMHI